MRNLRKPYQMYVLNLDSGRIFWLTTILLLLVTASFFIGFLIGRDRAKMGIDSAAQKNKVIMDEILNKIDESDNKDEDYQFYELVSPDRVIEKDIYDNGMADYEYVEKKSMAVNNKTYKSEPSAPVSSYKKKSSVKNKVYRDPVMDYGDKKLNSKRPFTVQVASYKRYRNARVLKNYLASEQYPSYIIKSNVNGVLYYRVRIGPFASKTLCLKVLEMAKLKKGCENSYITSK